MSSEASWFREQHEIAKARNAELPPHGGMVVTGRLFTVGGGVDA
jgi:hypothetical protein